MRKFIYILSVSSLLFLNCTTDSQEDLLEPVDMNPEETVNYTNDIQSIMANNCTFCHSNPPVNGATTSLVNYTQVAESVNNNGLINRISKQVGEAGAMPLGGPRLPQNLIDLIVQWQADGLLEN